MKWVSGAAARARWVGIRPITGIAAAAAVATMVSGCGGARGATGAVSDAGVSGASTGRVAVPFAAKVRMSVLSPSGRALIAETYRVAGTPRQYGISYRAGQRECYTQGGWVTKPQSSGAGSAVALLDPPYRRGLATVLGTNAVLALRLARSSDQTPQTTRRLTVSDLVAEAQAASPRALRPAVGRAMTSASQNTRGRIRVDASGSEGSMAGLRLRVTMNEISPGAGPEHVAIDWAFGQPRSSDLAQCTS